MGYAARNNRRSLRNGAKYPANPEWSDRQVILDPVTMLMAAALGGEINRGARE